MACWMVTGERQSERLRNMYLKAVLRQDITFFDTKTDMGEVVERMSGDMVLIQDAMGDKVISFDASLTGKLMALQLIYLHDYLISFN